MIASPLAAGCPRPTSRCWSRRRAPWSASCPSAPPARSGPAGPSWPAQSARRTWRHCNRGAHSNRIPARFPVFRRSNSRIFRRQNLPSVYVSLFFSGSGPIRQTLTDRLYWQKPARRREPRRQNKLERGRFGFLLGFSNSVIQHQIYFQSV